MSEPPPDLDLRKEWTRLRALLYEAQDLSLSTDTRDGHRWLTDRYVLLDVTDSIAIEGVPDGVFKLVQKSGFVLRDEAVNYLGGGIVDYLDSVENGALWVPVYPSEWSVAEHPGKAMLLVAGYGELGVTPVLMGESTWATLHRHYGEPVVRYDVLSGRNLFRVEAPAVVAYVAGIRIPDGQEDVANAIAKLVDIESTSKVD